MWPSDWVDGEDITATRLTQWTDAIKTWGGNVSGGGFNLSNVGTLTFTTLGGHVAGNSKNLTGLGTLSFSLIDLGVASANVSQLCNIYHNANVRSGWGMEAASAAMHIYAPTSNPKILSLGFNSSSDGTTYTEKSYFDLNGCPVCPSTPTSSAGLPSGSIWRDAAAGNVLKMVP